MDKGELRAPFAGMVPFTFTSHRRFSSESRGRGWRRPGAPLNEMRHFTRNVWFAALALALGTAPAWAAEAPKSPGGTLGESTPALRDVDSAATVSASASDDLFLIHPWDNPQKYDSTHSGGPVSGVRPFVGGRESDRSSDPEMEPAGKGAAIRPTGIDAVKNYPNPFNAQTTIEFRLVAAGPVELSLFNLLGQSLRTVELGRLESGTHGWTWDGMLEGGRPAPSGIYFYRVSSGAFSALEKMVLLK